MYGGVGPGVRDIGPGRSVPLQADVPPTSAYHKGNGNGHLCWERVAVSSPGGVAPVCGDPPTEAHVTRDRGHVTRESG